MYKPISYDSTKIKSLKPKDKKKLRYWQTNLKPLGDWDKDGKLNVVDCFPYDPNQQGLTEIKEGIVSLGKKARKKLLPTEEEKMELAEEELKQTIKTEQKTPHVYLIVKMKDDKWYNWGAFTTENIKKVVEEASVEPDVEQVFVSRNPKEADIRNRELMLEKPIQKLKEFKTELTEGEVAKGIKKYAEKKEKEFSRNVERGLRLKRPRRSPVMRTSMPKVRSSGIPPHPSGWWRPGDTRYKDIEYEDLEVTDLYPEETEYYQRKRRLPRRVQQYTPVTNEQVMFRTRGPGTPRQPLYSPPRRRTTRPPGLVPIATINFVKPPMLYFGRRVKK